MARCVVQLYSLHSDRHPVLQLLESPVPVVGLYESTACITQWATKAHISFPLFCHECFHGLLFYSSNNTAQL